MWSFSNYSENIAFISDKEDKVLYKDLIQYASEFSYHMGKRSLVFCLCTNTPGSVIGYTSFIENQCVPVLLGASVDRELLDELVELYKPNYMWKPHDVIYDGESLFSLYDYELISLYSVNHAMDESLALLLTTSGSTGSPKFVRQSYDNIRINAEQIVGYLELDETERPITTLPMNYTYGLSIINSHLMVGATILLTDYGLMQKGFWEFFKSSQATSFGGVPYTYEMLDRLRFLRMDLPSLRYMTQAGGKLSPELHKKFAEYAENTGKKFIVMYGQCEATARMAYLPAEDSLRKYGYMGIAIPGGRFELIDAEGNVIDEPETPGELVYYGDNVTMGYAEKPEDLSLGDERHGRLETGDMAVVDNEGYYRIVGRKKRFLKVYGNRVNLDELDGMLKKQFSGIDAVCSGVDDHVYIFVKSDYMKLLQDKEAEKFLADKTGLNPVAFDVHVLDEIPRNDSGKVLYKELEKYYDI